MTSAAVPSPDTPDLPTAQTTPQDLLASLKTLTHKVRAAQRGAWFPLLLLGALLAIGIVVNRLTFSLHTAPCPQAGNVGCRIAKQGFPLYWTLGLVLVYAATAVFYIRRSRGRGVGSPIRPYVIAGVVIVALVAPTRFWDAGQTTQPGALVDFWGLHFHATLGTEAFLSRLTGRAMSIGIPLLVLSWIERNRALLLFALAYLAVELIPITIGPAAVPMTPWGSLQRLAVPALLLLLGGVGFALAERNKTVRVSDPEPQRDQT